MGSYKKFQQIPDPGDVRSFGLSVRFPIFVITYMEILPSVVLSLYMPLWAPTIVRGAPEQLVYEMLSPHAVAFFAFFHLPRSCPFRRGRITPQRDMSTLACTLVDGLFMLQSHAHFQLMAPSPPPPIACFLMFKSFGV